MRYRSKLHQDIKRQEREAKEQQKKDYMIKQEKNERIRNYSKNVKDLYMPGGPRSSKSQKRTDIGSDGRSAYVGTDVSSEITSGAKEIRKRLRSGAAQQRHDYNDSAATNNQISVEGSGNK